MTVTMKITGLGEIRLMLKELPTATEKNAVRKALIDAAQPIVLDAANRAPVDQGELRKAMIASTQIVRGQKKYVKKTGKDGVRAFIGPNYSRTSKGKGYAPHAHLVEFGTGPRYHRGTGKYVGQMPAQPFMRPAFDAGKEKFIADFQVALLKRIEKAMKRLAAKNRRKRAA